MRVAVVGMGPIGSIIGTFLKQAGNTLVICDNRASVIRDIEENGLRVMGKGNGGISSNLAHPDAAVTNAAHLNRFDLDLICIAIKAPFNKLVIRDLQKGGLQDHLFCILENGLDNEQDFANAFGKRRIMRMVLNMGGEKINAKSIYMNFFKPPNYLGYLDPSSESVAQLFAESLSDAKIPTKVVNNIRLYTWEKCILNACLGTICAIVGKKMKDFMDDPIGYRMVNDVITECVSVAARDEIYLPIDFRDKCMEFLKGAGNHKPSILIDIENKYKTEIDWMNGRIADIAEQQGSSAPLNRMIWGMLRMMEGEEISIDVSNDDSPDLTMQSIGYLTSETL